MTQWEGNISRRSDEFLQQNNSIVDGIRNIIMFI